MGTEKQQNKLQRAHFKSLLYCGNASLPQPSFVIHDM